MPPTSRTAKRQERARARLLESASQLIAEKGVEGLRLRDITDAADVGFGSFYSHFADKDALVEAVVIDLLNQVAARLIHHIEPLEDPAEAGSFAHRWFVRNARLDPQTAWLIVHLDRADVLFQQAIAPYAKPMLERGMQSGRFRPMDVDVTLAYVVGATMSVTRGVLEGRLGPDAEAASTAALLGALGLSAPDAQAVAARDLPFD